MQFKKIKYIAFVLLLLNVVNENRAYSQSSSDLIINEFLVFNDSNYVDNFGNRGAWIEIFNSAYNKVDLGGMYITNDLDNPKKYSIPKGKPNTSIPPRSYALFWADNHPTRGIFHLNFELEGAKVIALFDADGKTLVDSVHIPAGLPVDRSYARITDGNMKWIIPEKTTPLSDNDTEIKISKADQFGKLDSSGVAMTVIAMSVVFSALAFLFVFFKTLGKIMQSLAKRKNRQKDEAVGVVEKKEELSGEVNAAIALALCQYFEDLQDNKVRVLTIDRVTRNYSPWSSKIYGLRRYPN